MAGQLKVDSINADSNLTLRIANTAVAFIDSNGLRPTSGNVSLDATGTTGVRSPSANTLVGYTAGVEAIRVDSSQNVGIGTTNPSTLFTVGSSTKRGLSTLVGNSTTVGSPRFNLDNSAATGGKTFGLYVGNTAAGSFNISNITDGLTVMDIDSSGRMTKPYQPAFRAGRTASGTVADGATVIFDTAAKNIGSCYSTSTGRFTAPVAGMYHFSIQVLFEGLSAGNQLEMQFRINGGDNMAFGPRVKYQADYTGWNGYVNLHGNTSVYLNANDYVEAQQICGASRTVYGSASAVWSIFSGFLIG